jgi:hypothetical protein
MKAVKLVVALLGLLLVSACTRAQIRYDYDARANYASFKTFDWMVAPKRAKEKAKNVDNPIMDRRVKGAIERELTAKGFQLEATGDPDFLVTYYPVYKDRAFRTTTHVGMGWGYRPRWGSHAGMTMSQVHTYQEGTIVVEIVDFKTNQLVWHGAAVGALTGLERPEDAEEVVAQEVRRLLEGFPPKR